jgi:hypothetical protein
MTKPVTSDLLTGLDEGELYVFKQGQLEHVKRDPDDTMRRVRITEEAYQRAMTIGKAMRQRLGGYKPEVSLIGSAVLLFGTTNDEEVQQYVKQLVLTLFQD